MTSEERQVKRLAFLSAATPEAEAARTRLVQLYGDADPTAADIIVALGGDGFMLQTLHRFMGGKPIYGMNRGSVGFLMNDFSVYNLERRASRTPLSIIHPLADAGDRTQASFHARGDQRGLAAAPILSGGQDANFCRWQGAAGRTGRAMA